MRQFKQNERRVINFLPLAIKSNKTGQCRKAFSLVASR